MVERWWWSWAHVLAPYAVLMRLLIDGRITGEEFEVLFLSRYLNDPSDWPEEIYRVLDGFFADVDDFCPDPALRADTRGLDEPELRRRATTAFERLSVLQAEPRLSVLLDSLAGPQPVPPVPPSVPERSGVVRRIKQWFSASGRS